MHLKHVLLVVTLVVAFGVVGASYAYEYKAQRRSVELSEQVHRCAPNGATRSEVERSLQAEGLPYHFSAPSNVIISPWIPIGRYRLLWQTQFFYQINFDNSGHVTGFETKRFNEGL
jgi:hypothetical protein